jgi:hypothetical protein
MRAHAYVDLAQVLRMAGRSGEAAEALETAGARYDSEGNVVAARPTRALLVSFGPWPTS